MRIDLTDAEEKLAALIWREAPVQSPVLVAFANDELGWKKSTTYTVLKKLCQKGVFQNSDATVTPMTTRDELISKRSRRFVEDAFGGSLPGFITSFYGGGKLSADQVAELMTLIEESGEDE